MGAKCYCYLSLRAISANYERVNRLRRSLGSSKLKYQLRGQSCDLAFLLTVILACPGGCAASA